MPSEKTINVNALWWIPAAVPLLFIIISFGMGGWNWGLMDDTTMVAKSGSILERIILLYNELLPAGRFMPTTYLYWASFYKIFAASPTAFFIFRWFEITAILALWGWLAARITGHPWSAALLITIALGFYKFHDSFFYLSIAEPHGLLFAAPAILLFFDTVKPAFDDKKTIHWQRLALSILLLLAAIGSKETFIITGLSLGLATLITAFNKKINRSLLILGTGLLTLCITYILIVKFFLIHGYSSDYQITNIKKLIDNARQWFVVDLPCHTPWLVILLTLSFVYGKPVLTRTSHYFAILLGTLLYCGYTIILLPWNTTGHYSVPLGIFFAFTMTLLITHRLNRLKPAFHITLIVMALIFNVIIGSAALQWHHTYQTDTKNLVTWISQNAIFQHDLQSGTTVRINATEPGDTIPALVKRTYGNDISPFIFTANVREVLSDPATKYYLWGPHWGNQDLRRLGSMWTPVFTSDNWIMFRRLY